MGRELHLEGQSGWEFYDGGDAPGGAFLGRIYAGVSSLPATVELPDALMPGSYRIFLKMLDYDTSGRASFNLGGSTGTVNFNDRDLNGYWTEPVIVNLSRLTNRVSFTFAKVVPPEATMRYMWMGLFITTNATDRLMVDRYDYLLDWRYPTSADLDNRIPTKGNVVPNSSFEVGMGGGWGLHSMPFREESISEAWAPEVGVHGKGSLELALPTNRWIQATSKPFYVKPNKKYTLSAYVRSTGQNWATIHLFNGYLPPEAPGFTNVQLLSKGIMANNNWQRMSVSGHLLKYPVADFHINLVGQAYEGGKVYFDAVQLEEGDLSLYSPRSPLEAGLVTTNVGRIFYDDEPAKMDLFVFNSTSATITTNVDYEILDYHNRTVSSGAHSVTVNAGSTAVADFPLPVSVRGIFRIRLWLRGLHNSEEEVVYSIVPRPSVQGADPGSLMGGHIDMYHRQLLLMQRLGIKWTRGLSTGQYWRWLNAEPVEGNFVWWDTEVARPAEYGISIMANIGENVPIWAQRTYFALTNLAGSGFTVGESVRSSSGGAGRVTVVLDTSHATGHALQLTEVTGTFLKGDLVTGNASGATARLRTRSFPQSAALDKWDRYVETVVTHYRNKVQAWEIWNEPDQDGEEVPQIDEDNSFYAEILRRAALKIRAIAPEAQIVGMGGVLYHDWIRRVMDRLGPAATTYMDVMSVHLYHPNGVVSSDLKRHAGDVYNKPLWNTETGGWDLGFYSGVNANFQLQGRALMPYREAHRFYNSQVHMPAAIAMNFLESIGGGITRYFYYDSRTAARPDFYKGHTTMIEYDDSIRPKGVVYSILGHFFDHSIGRGRVPLADGDVRIYLFEKSGVGMAAVFNTGKTNKVLDLTATLTAVDLKTYEMMGNALPSTARVPCERTPVYVAGQNVTVERLRTAFSNAIVSVQPDTQAPTLTLTVGPRGSGRWGDLTQFRWLAIDNQDVPIDEDPLATVYSYKLEGADADWSPWGQTTWVEYDHLETGEYSFQVKARDKSGNVSGVVVRPFEVPPPVRSPTRLRVLDN